MTPVNSSMVDTSDHSSFPSLQAPSTARPPRNAKSAAWGADSGPRIKATIRSQPMVSDSFTLSAIELAANKDGKPTSLGEIMKQVMSKFKVKIEASANQKTRQTTFHMKSESQKELDKAKRNLFALLSPVVRSRVVCGEFFSKRRLRSLLPYLLPSLLFQPSSDPKVGHRVSDIYSGD